MVEIENEDEIVTREAETVGTGEEIKEIPGIEEVDGRVAEKEDKNCYFFL